jgi:hypothetical protein
VAKRNIPLAKTFALSRDDWSIIAATLALKLLLFVFAAQAFSALANEWVGGFRGAIDIWNRWDSLVYLHIADEGYRSSGDQIAWLVLFPLYPWTVRALTLITRDSLISGMLISTVALPIAAIALRRLTLVDRSEPIATRATWFMLIFPTAFFLHIAYAEAMFLALAIGAFLAMRRDRWLLAGVLGGIAAMTRINGALLAPAFGIEALMQLRATRKWNWRWLWLALIPLGFSVYLWVNYATTGDAFKFMEIQRTHFWKHISPPWVGVADRFQYIWGHPPVDAVITGVQENFFIWLTLAAAVASWFTMRASYAVWMTLNWLLFTSAGFVVCTPRYALVMFPIFILFAQWSENRVARAVITAWSLLFLALFTAIFVQGWWMS